MNQNIKNILIVLIAVILIVGVGFLVYQYRQENDISKLEVYDYKEDGNYVKCLDMEGVEFSYPSNYESVGTSTQPTFMDPDISGASVNLISENAQNLSLENYIRISTNSIRESLEIKGEIEQNYINLNGIKAAKLDYVAKQQNDADVKITQVVIMKSGKAYILTVGCLPADSEKLKEKTDKIIRSFQ